MKPAAIEKRLGLRNPIYRETSAYGHFGKEPRKERKFLKALITGK